MSDDEAPEADVLEQLEPPTGERAPVDPEAPEADVAEQLAPVEPTEGGVPALPLDVDEADAADQQRLVELDEDDYR